MKSLTLDDIIMNIRKYGFTKKTFAYVLCAVFSYYAYNTATECVIPQAYGDNATGADVTDVATTGVSILLAIISAVASQFLGVKPELIQAVLNFEKDRNNQEYQRRLGAAIISYIISVLKNHPDGVGGYLLYLINTIVNAVKDTDPEIAKTLSAAASEIAVTQFKSED